MESSPWLRCDCGKMHITTYVSRTSMCKCGLYLYPQIKLRPVREMQVVPLEEPPNISFIMAKGNDEAEWERVHGEGLSDEQADKLLRAIEDVD